MVGFELGRVLFGFSFTFCSTPAFLLDQDKFWTAGFVDGLVSLSLHWRSCLATGSDLFMFHVPTIGLRLLLWTPGSLPYARSLGLPKDSLLHHQQLEISIHFFDSLGLSSAFSPLLFLPPHSFPPPLSHSGPALPLPPMIVLFPHLSMIQAFLLGPSNLFNFFGSLGYVMYFMINIHLISEYTLCMYFGIWVTSLGIFSSSIHLS